ncbi:MAG TPA: peptidylprolyl isomerase [Dongiaceae bacterium]|nr:peptidylprolyl isomerase [Dongiaceae bacterium]
MRIESAKLRQLLSVVAAAAFLLGGCNAKEQPAPETSKPAEAAAPPAATPDTPDASMAMQAKPATTQSGAAKPTTAAASKDYTKELLTPAKWKEKAPETYKVKFDTTRGEFTLTVTRALAPLGADRFYNLVKHHFYDGAAFFRVVPNFVVQFGISGTPSVSAAWKHTELKDDPVKGSNKKGTITFATAGPNTRTTQVFINLKDNERLNGMGFAPFGTVDGTGMNVVEMMYEGYGDDAGPDQDQIEKQGTPYLKKGWPKLDYIKSATLVP